MLSFLNKNKNKKNKENLITKIFAPTSGKVVQIESVEDPVFSQKMMGDGYAVIPESSDVFAPVEGRIVSVFPTKHAISILTTNGEEVLIHMGIDTVSLGGKPFEIFVKEGDKVNEKVQLASINLELLQKEKKDPSIIIIFTKIDEGKELLIEELGYAKEADYIGKVR